MRNYKPKEFAGMIGVAVITLQRWDNAGTLKAFRTPTNRRFYTSEQYDKYMREVRAGVISSAEETTDASEEELLDLEQYRRSPNRGAGASLPKRCYSSPQGEIYFKFGMTDNEICAELFAYYLAGQLGINAACTKLAKSGSVLGVASYDIGDYAEPSDEKSYSVKDYTSIEGFVFMCLFDYLIMNEDRHAGNWGIAGNKVAALFDHNYAFGGPDAITDADNFMRMVTSPFYADNENDQRHDSLLLYFVKRHPKEVSSFMDKLNHIREVSNALWRKHFPDDCRRLNSLLKKRILYMREKVGEYSAK